MVRKFMATVLLLAAASVAAATTDQLWAGSAASGAALDSGVVDTSHSGCVLVAIKNSGSGVSGACTVSMVRNDGTTNALGATFTVAAGATSYAGSVCPGVGTGFGFAAPAPRRMQLTCAGAVNAALSVVIEGR
jgi:hypothetical protein